MAGEQRPREGTARESGCVTGVERGRGVEDEPQLHFLDEPLKQTIPNPGCYPKIFPEGLISLGI